MRDDQRFELLRHMNLHNGITVPEAVEKSLLPHDVRSREIAAQLLEELVAEGLVGKADLTPAEPYYFLNPKAAEVLRVGQVNTGPLNRPTKLLEAYACLYLCAIDTATWRMKISPEEFRDRFGDLYRPGPNCRAYYSTGSNLGYVICDSPDKVKGDPTRAIAKAFQAIKKRQHPKQGQIVSWTELLEAQPSRFEITLATAFEQKARRLRRELAAMTELYHRFRESDLKKRRGAFVAQDTYREYVRYKRRDSTPRLPPPLRIAVLPKLLDIMFPKPNPVR